MDKDGVIKPMVIRKTIKPKSVTSVSFQLMRMIERRQYKLAFTVLGKINAFLNRFFPRLVNRILLHEYHRNNK